MTKRTWALFLLCLATLLWIGFIFGNSMQTGTESGEASGSVTDWINQTVQSLLPRFRITEAVIRKMAHFGEFALLSLLFCADFSLCFDLHRANKLRRRGLVLLAVPSCALIAVTDETIQRFSVGRSPSLADVFIDTGGAAFAAFCFFGLLCALRRKGQKTE